MPSSCKPIRQKSIQTQSRSAPQKGIVIPYKCYITYKPNYVHRRISPHIGQTAYASEEEIVQNSTTILIYHNMMYMSRANIDNILYCICGRWFSQCVLYVLLDLWFRQYVLLPYKWRISRTILLRVGKPQNNLLYPYFQMEPLWFLLCRVTCRHREKRLDFKHFLSHKEGVQPFGSSD